MALDPEQESLDVPVEAEEEHRHWWSGLFENFWDWAPTAVAFLAIYGLLIGFFRPNLIFSLTTTSGGDTGAYHYPAQYLINELLPNWRLTGWAPGWYAGMPMLTFYFPFPFLLIALLDYVLPYAIAFKLVTILGVFLLPLTVYAMARLWRIRKPFPVVAAVFAASFLLMEHTAEGQLYSIYGGNILSTLAGEFGYMLSFALVFLFLGTMYRGMEKPRFNLLFVLNCLILMALVLSHIVTTIVLVLIAPGLLLSCLPFLRPGGMRAMLRSFGYLLAVAVVGLCLTAFWWMPFLAHLKWTAFMKWPQLGWKYLLPPNWQFITVFVLGILGIAFAVARKEWRLLPLLWFTLVAFLMFKLMPAGRLWNGRLVPFWYVSWYVWAAYAVAWIVRPFAVILWDLVRCRGSIAKRIYVPIVAIVVVATTAATSSVAGGWIDWNYKGYEGKGNWTEYRQILDYIAKIGDAEPHARVMVEHGDKIDEFGTPRAFEIIPYWTNADTMEGTLMEASYTASFHFINQRELSEQASDAILGVKYPPDIDVTRGITHLQLMNIPYLLAFTDDRNRVIPAVEADPRTKLLASFGDYRIYHISGSSGYVEIPKYEPVRVSVKQSDWRDMAVNWYENADALQVPLVWDNGEQALQQFASVSPAGAVDPPKVPLNTTGQVSNVQLENDSLSFDTTAIGVPHWIKISYFPNWHVTGAEGPYLASPSMMMVIPTQSHVVLYYGRTPANNWGQGLEVFGWVLLLGVTIWRVVVRIKRGPTPVLEGPAELTPPPLPDGTAGGRATRPQEERGEPESGWARASDEDYDEYDEYYGPPSGPREPDDQHIPDFDEDAPRD